MVMHPAISFLQHYALVPLAERGLAAMGVNSRYAGNDTFLFMEKLPLDLAAAVGHLRKQHEHVVLLGNSGGGALAAFYQSQAEAPSIRATPTGERADLVAAALQPADALVLLNAHKGRAEILTAWLDPAVRDERELLISDPALDMFDPANGPPYDTAFLARYRAAQRERNRRITSWAKARLTELRDRGVRDETFTVHRTTADPRFLDLALDPSDREPGMYYGPDVRAANYAAQGLARTCSLRSWISQWSLDDTRASAADSLRGLQAPVLFVQGTADQGIFNSDVRELSAAAGAPDEDVVWIRGGTHYFIGQPEQLDAAMDAIAGWLERRGLA